MFLLVPAHPGSPRQKLVQELLLLFLNRITIGTTTTTTVLWPFVRDYPGELIPEETFTRPPS